MARPKTYNRKEAVESACYAFWQHGYSALGVRELEQLTGLNKFAIRTEFGGKEGLYLEALRHYINAAAETALAPMRSGGVKTVEEFFENLTLEHSVVSSPWGCLVVNTGIENAELDRPALKEISDEYWKMLSDHFEMALNKSKDAGEIDRNLYVPHASQGLVTAVMGIHTKNRVTQTHNGGETLVKLILDLIGSWRI